MTEMLRTIKRIFELNIERSIFYAKYCYGKKDYKGCYKWIDLGNSQIKFLEYYMKQKPDYNPISFFDDISFAIDKDTGTKILQKYPNT